MLVGIDARMISWSGIGRYSQNLIKGLQELGSDVVQPFLFYDIENENYDTIAAVSQKKVVDVPVFSLLAASQLSKQIDDVELDLYHSPHFVLPAGIADYPFVITVHDLIPLIINETMPNPIHRQLYYRLNKISCKKAARIIAISMSTKQDIMRIFNVPDKKIDVVYNAPDEIFGKVGSKEVEAAKEKLSIKGSYIFALGNQKPNKGLECLIDAFSKLVKDNVIEHKLVITGQPDPRFDGTHRRIIHNDLSEHVYFAGDVNDADLVALYNGAAAFLFPSLYEGFGVPPLEAMACETPVITSNLSSIPEVVGDAALMVNPESIDDLADAILKVTSDPDLARQLVEKGLRQCKMFSVEQFIEGTIDVYQKALSG